MAAVLASYGMASYDVLQEFPRSVASSVCEPKSSYMRPSLHFLQLLTQQFLVPEIYMKWLLCGGRAISHLFSKYLQGACFN